MRRSEALRFTRAWVALVITGLIGGLSLAFQQPWLFPSLGPTIFIHTVTPNQKAARPWSTFAGHGISAAQPFCRLAFSVRSMPRQLWRPACDRLTLWRKRFGVGLTARPRVRCSGNLFMR